MAYYPFSYRLDNAAACLLWYTDISDDGTDPDGVVLDVAGFILTFRHVDDLRAEAARLSLPVEQRVNPEPLDLDAMEHWLASSRKATMDCETFLNAWNLFSDLASTVQNDPAHIDGQREGRIYDKLFWGTNIRVLTPPGKHYEPLWSKSEVGRMRNVLGAGMRLFRDRLGPDMAVGARECRNPQPG